jgi:hypothetical protein
MLGDAPSSPAFGAESAVLLHLIASIDPDGAGAVPRNRQAFSRNAHL